MPIIATTNLKEYIHLRNKQYKKQRYQANKHSRRNPFEKIMAQNSEHPLKNVGILFSLT